jgi:hypothetical protein
MKNLLCFLYALSGLTGVYAQRAQKDIYSNASTGSAAITSIEKYAQLFYGMPIPEFSAYAPDGKTISNRSLSGKVSLILFWYPRHGSDHGKLSDYYLKLGTLPALTQQYKDFQIISLLPDTMDLALYRQQHPDLDLFTPANLQSHAKARELCPGRSMPCCALVDRNGNIARTWSLGRSLDEEGMIAKIRELEMQ